MQIKTKALLIIVNCFFIILASCNDRNTKSSQNTVIDTLKALQLSSTSNNIIDSASLGSEISNDQPRPTSIQLEILASESSVVNSEWTGHAFMVISIPLSSGIKEDGYGFYPRNAGVGQIYGPGIVRNEINYNPGRFSRIAISIKKPITDQQRRSVLQITNEWNDREFALTNQNCIDFIKTIAQAVGWNTVERQVAERPSSYIRRIKDANE